MTNNFASKGQPPSYQRWQMSSFDAVDLPVKTPNEVSEVPKIPEVSSIPGGTSESSDSIIDSPTVNQPSKAELAVITAEAKEQGYRAGYEEGKASGHREGHDEGHAKGYAEGRSLGEKEVKEDVAQMQALLSNFSQNLDEMSGTVADELLTLAITISKKMITQAFTIKPQLIVPIVREAMLQLPHAMQHPKLYLHPDDAKIMRAHLDDELIKQNWSIREDDEITRGGCRIVTESSEINATVEMRWQKILSAIGQKDNWME